MAGVSGRGASGPSRRQWVRLEVSSRPGTVRVNQGAAGAHTTMGGYKQSGTGSERCVPGSRAFQEIEHIVIGTR